MTIDLNVIRRGETIAWQPAFPARESATHTQPRQPPRIRIIVAALPISIENG